MTLAKDATAKAGKTTTGFDAPLVTEAGRVLVFLLFAGVAAAQYHQARPMRPFPIAVPPPATAVPATAAEVPAPAPTTVPAQPVPPPPSEKRPTVATRISYVDGQLRIDAFDITLADVLTKVADLTGVIIEIPPGARTEHLPVVQLGPGTARQVLAELLSDSTFDFLIQSPSADPEKLQSVLLIPRDKKGGGASTADGAARPPRGPSALAAAQPEAPVPDSSVPAQPEIAAPAASSLNAVAEAPPAQPSTPPAQTAALPDLPMQMPSSLQQDPSAMSRPGALAPPATLTPQSINQQLQQMYQTRVQMIQPAAAK
jgi:hypothetical protein